jgi:hypothetical protein
VRAGQAWYRALPRQAARSPLPGSLPRFWRAWPTPSPSRSSRTSSPVRRPGQDRTSLRRVSPGHLRNRRLPDTVYRPSGPRHRGRSAPRPRTPRMARARPAPPCDRRDRLRGRCQRGQPRGRSHPGSPGRVRSHPGSPGRVRSHRVPQAGGRRHPEPQARGRRPPGSPGRGHCHPGPQARGRSQPEPQARGGRRLLILGPGRNPTSPACGRSRRTDRTRRPGTAGRPRHPIPGARGPRCPGAGQSPGRPRTGQARDHARARQAWRRIRSRRFRRLGLVRRPSRRLGPARRGIRQAEARLVRRQVRVRPRPLPGLRSGPGRRLPSPRTTRHR